MGEIISVADFERVEIRVGRVVEVHPFPEGRFSTHVLRIDLGAEVGIKKSLAKLAPHYSSEELVGRHVLCVVNFAARQIGKHWSEVLTLGVPDEAGQVVLVMPEREAQVGGRLF